MDRRSTYTPEFGLAVCQHLAEGGSLRKFCEAPDAPDKSTILRWLHAHADFREMYRIAREVGADALADEALADATTPMGEKEVQVARLAFDARRWFLGKISPKKWGDKIGVAHTGADGGPVQLQALPAMLVPTQVAQAVRDLIGKAEQEMGLAPGDGTDQERLQRLLVSGEPLPPDVYEIVHASKG
jgi:hypothetical protein